MEIKQETYHRLGDTTDRLMIIISHSMETIDAINAGINQFKNGLQMMEQYVMQQKKLLLSIIIEAPFPKPQQPPHEEEESTTEEETSEEEQKIEVEEEEEEKHEEEEQQAAEEEEKHEEEEEEEEDVFIYDPEDQKVAKVIAPPPKVPIAETSEKPYARKPYKVILKVSQQAYNQYAYLYKKALKIINNAKQFEDQKFQHHLACIEFTITTKIADVSQLLQNTKTSVHWCKKLKKTAPYKNKDARKITDKLLETLRRMKAILKNL